MYSLKDFNQYSIFDVPYSIFDVRCSIFNIKYSVFNIQYSIYRFHPRHKLFNGSAEPVFESGILWPESRDLQNNKKSWAQNALLIVSNICTPLWTKDLFKINFECWKIKRFFIWHWTLLARDVFNRFLRYWIEISSGTESYCYG